MSRLSLTHGLRLLVPIVVVVGCALESPETRYLRSARDVAHRDDVEAYLGPPLEQLPLATGEERWIYTRYHLEPGSQNSWASMGSWCNQYELTFDPRGVLRSWTQQTQRHGDTMSPVCIRR